MLEALRDAFMNSEHSYQRISRLHGHTEPVSCLAFTTDGDVLASGGDDQAVRIWSVKNQKCRQIITDGNRWGQITCLKWLASETPTTLCFGTGRGRVLIYRRARSAKLLVESSNTQVFVESDSVEAIAYDPIHQRLVASSHFGKLQAYSTEKLGTLNPLWSSSMESMIPRALHFVDDSQTILIFGLEKGEIVARDAATSHRKWSKTLKSAIGSAAVCSNERYILVENLSTGFDLYRMDRTSPSCSFNIPNNKRFIKEGRFGENSTTVVCGSDHGKVYVFGVAKGENVQVLKHGNGESLVQMIDVATSNERHLIASGSSDAPYDISIWAKPKTQSVNNKRDHRPRRDTLPILNSIVLVILAWWIVNASAGPIIKIFENTAISFSEATPRFEDSKWRRVLQAKQIEEEAERGKRDTRVHVILQKRHEARDLEMSSEWEAE